jgi:uncharacterized protein (DUF58 family)
MSPATNVNHAVILGRRQLYILPTRHGWLFALVLGVLLIAAINYSNGLAYGLTFLLASTAIVSMLYTHRNLHKLKITPGVATPVFAGETAAFEICLTNDRAAPRLGLRVEQEIGTHGQAAPWKLRGQREVARVDLGPGASGCLTLPRPAQRRGWLAAPVFRVATVFPLGLLYSWSRRLELEQRCLVYPRPAAPMPLQTAMVETAPTEYRPQSGGDDFAGLRDYHAGDSPRHIHWKAVARTQRWYTKQFGGGVQASHWLDWDSLEGLETEARLSVLTRWVLDAEQSGDLYGLRLPGTNIAPANGERHQQRCLAALALFGH